MKFKNYVQTMVGVDIFPIISLLLFFTFFILMGIMVWKMSKEYANKMGNIPFESDDFQNNQLKENYEKVN